MCSEVELLSTKVLITVFDAIKIFTSFAECKVFLNLRNCRNFKSRHLLHQQYKLLSSGGFVLQHVKLMSLSLTCYR